MGFHLPHFSIILYKISGKKHKVGKITLEKLSSEADIDISPPFLNISMIYIIFKD